MYMYMCVYMPRHRAALEERVYAGDLMQAEAAEFVPYSKFAQDVSAMLASCKVCSSFPCLLCTSFASLLATFSLSLASSLAYTIAY